MFLLLFIKSLTAVLIFQWGASPSASSGWLQWVGRYWPIWLSPVSAPMGLVLGIPLVSFSWTLPKLGIREWLTPGICVVVCTAATVQMRTLMLGFGFAHESITRGKFSTKPNEKFPFRRTASLFAQLKVSPLVDNRELLLKSAVRRLVEEDD